MHGKFAPTSHVRRKMLMSAAFAEYPQMFDMQAEHAKYCPHEVHALYVFLNPCHVPEPIISCFPFSLLQELR